MSVLPKKKLWTFSRRRMRVRVIYRTEAEGVWAESPDVPGYSAVGASLDEVRQLVAEGLPDFLGKQVDLVESEASMIDDLQQELTFRRPTGKPYDASFDQPRTGTRPKLIAS
jgi:predicted RNase H-like HicB family nuclease